MKAQLMPTATPDDALALTDLIGVLKWVGGIASTVIVTAFVALFGWVWRTDRAVQGMAIAAEQDREARQEWRKQMLEWMRRLDERVSMSEIQNAEQRGREAGRNERQG